ncbi:MAG: hypothetical protein COX90_01905 [Candidatus Nealsonbacteria bacterium CG_4_10_14_0_2_um_filter_38_17]|uniref:Uncharacterized protein n=2 Tax=Candidatus Nealsoniibacteriota TaxID=1817911 RepID=A0A2M7UYC2_9BACT|nr:MAG: hypothetical protein COX36_03585 [Candidatus Nealsonbacteria bacterium CG23_combo_of_CG06-09_8_20_14_all_38_19]PIZ88976.1 MAG: hypothetical protein COX90_01905 [Candidatus Nealsonbacteria bacterium CG_4_10_14_0_2_um_filter_38_17]
MILVSACLLGINCKYNGESNLCEEVLELLKDKGEFIAICPECLGSLSIPRDPSEIVQINGKQNKILVKSIRGENVTQAFLKGARKALKVAKNNNVKLAILRSKSPSCGAGQTYDGTFSGKLVKNDGITAALLKKHGIRVVTEVDIKNYIWLREKEKSGTRPLF